MTLQKLKRALVGAMLFSGSVGFATQAHALDIDASTLAMDGWVLNTNYWTTNNSPAAIDENVVETLVGFAGDLGRAYKIDYDTSEEAGTGAMYYSTTFSGEPNDATISWSGSQYIVCGDCYLVVKDGNAEPDLYVFDIGAWNGQDPINLSNFWNGPQGAISYVGIYNNYSMEDGGGNVAMVPEADTYAMLLAGLGLVGFAARRKLGKTA